MSSSELEWNKFKNRNSSKTRLYKIPKLTFLTYYSQLFCVYVGVRYGVIFIISYLVGYSLVLCQILGLYRLIITGFTWFGSMRLLAIILLSSIQTILKNVCVLFVVRIQDTSFFWRRNQNIFKSGRYRPCFLII